MQLKKIMEFRSYNSCWLSIAGQDTQRWKDLHFGRLTAHNFAAAIGESNFKTPDQVVDEILGLAPPVTDPKQLRRMKRGMMIESYLRSELGSYLGRNIATVGIAISRSNPFLGASTDGIPFDCNIAGCNHESCFYDKFEELDECAEFKLCDGDLYSPLIYQLRNRFKTCPKSYHHIWREHFIQMQGNMAILGKKKCRYAPCGKYGKGHILYIETVYFDQELWDGYLERINEFIEKKLKPRLEKMGRLPIFPDTFSILEG
jgi:hypothetical protein